MGNTMTGKLRIAVLQIPISAGSPDANYRLVEQRLAEAAAGTPKPDVIVLPEMWNTGYALDQIQELADADGARTKELLSAFAREHGIHVVGGSVAEKRGDEVYNTIHTFDREGGQSGSYSKIHLFRLMQEEKHLAAGSEPGLFQLEGEQAGMMICYDIRFPELARKLALGEPRSSSFLRNGRIRVFIIGGRCLPRARSRTKCTLSPAIVTGQSGNDQFFGHSMIIDPWGEIIAEGDEEETILTADIDLALVDEVRGRIPVFHDRRPSLY